MLALLLTKAPWKRVPIHAKHGRTYGQPKESLSTRWPAEASRNEQTKTASIDPDSSLDLDLITDSEPFDQFNLHPIAKIELPMDSVELSCPGRIDTHHLIQLESCRPSLSPPIPIPLAATQIVTPLLPRRWEDMLHQHPDQSLAAYIVSGLSNGFHIGHQGDRKSGWSVPVNMLSAVRNPMPVEQYWLTEVSAERISGPFRLDEVPLVHVSRFGVIPKSGTPGDWRLILDLSFPAHTGVSTMGLHRYAQCDIQQSTRP